MPETETPGEKTFRRFYEGRIVARLLQVASLERNRAILRRGALKMQDGTLGVSGEPPSEDPMNISIGDTYQLTPTPTAAATPGAGTGTATGPAQPAAETPLWKKAAALAAIMAATGGGGAGLTAYLMQPVVEPVVEKAVEAIVPPPGYDIEVEKVP